MAGCYQKRPLGVRYLDKLHCRRRRTVGGPLRHRAYDQWVTPEDAPEPTDDQAADDLSTDGAAQERSGFTALDLDPRLLHTLAELGYEEPTPIQIAAIPPLLGGKDLLAEAPTGTGKTAAFALPVLNRLSIRLDELRTRGDPADGRGAPRSGEKGSRPRSLVLTPTRELAMQVAEAMHKYGRELGARVVPVYGGQPITAQLHRLARGVDIVVATPGRAVDHLERGSIRLDEVETVVLDEADEMLDMGFADDLERILGSLPEVHQTALFSATISGPIARLAGRHLRHPVQVRVQSEATAGEASRVRQVAYVVRRADKLAALGRILDLEDGTATLVFARTRGEVDDLAEAPERPRPRRGGAPRRPRAGAARPDHGPLPGRRARRPRRHRCRRPWPRHRAGDPRRQLRRAFLAGRVRPPHRPDRTSGPRGRRHHPRGAARAPAAPRHRADDRRAARARRAADGRRRPREAARDPPRHAARDAPRGRVRPLPGGRRAAVGRVRPR